MTQIVKWQALHGGPAKMPVFAQALLLTLAFFCISPFLGGEAYAQSAFDDPGGRSGGSAGGGLAAVEAKVDGGTVSLGSGSQVVVLFRNDGLKPVSSGVINLYPSSNVSSEVATNQCAQEPLEPGAVCAIALTVKGLQPGNYRIEMLMRHDGRSRLITATVSGNVETTGDGAEQVISDIEAIPAEIDFGSLNASRTLVGPVVLRNITSNPIEIEAIDLQTTAQSGFKLETDCRALETGQACLASVSWSPEQDGPSTGILIVKHNGPTGITTVPLNGSYEPDSATIADIFPEPVPGKGLLVSSQSDVDFGSGVEVSSSITVSLVNAGDAPLTLFDISLSNEENGMLISRAGCRPGTVLKPIEACPLTLVWEPVREGDIVDDIQISHSGARGILVLPLRGEASAAINKDTKAIVFGSGPGGILRNIPPVDLGPDDSSFAASLGPDGRGRAGSEAGQGPGSRGDGSDSGGPGGEGAPGYRGEVADLRGVLDGFTVTSHAPRRAVIAGPGGSRVVFDGQETVIGGVLWRVGVRPSAVEFFNGDQRVMLLFDRSLSSVNRNEGQSDSEDSSGDETEN